MVNLGVHQDFKDEKLLIILLMGMFLVSFVGAAVLPMKSFDDKIGDYGKVTIHNWNIIGKIFDLKLAELELKENTDNLWFKLFSRNRDSNVSARKFNR